MNAPYIHVVPRRIVMAEVDVAQIHFTTFFNFMDRGLTEWLGEIGHSFTRILEEGPGIPIVSVGLDIQRRVHLDDVIVVETAVGAVGRSSFRSRHLFRRGEEEVARGHLVHVCVDRTTRETQPVPDWIRRRAVFDAD